MNFDKFEKSKNKKKNVEGRETEGLNKFLFEQISDPSDKDQKQKSG